MRLWESNKGLIIAVGVVLVIWWGVRSFAIGSVKAATADHRANAAAGLSNLRKYTKAGGTPVGDAMAGLGKEAGALKAVHAGLDAAEFVLEARFEDTDRPQARLYFEQELDAVREHAREAMVAYKDAAAPLGFKGKFVTKDKVSDLLKRLALADHLRRSLEKAGVESVTGVTHLDIETHGGDDMPVYVEEYPISVSVLAHERSLISLLHHLQHPSRCAPVRKLSIVVADPKSGSFTADIEVSALFVERKKKVERETKVEDDPYKIRRPRRRD